jgi:hypothetical protein
MASKYDGQHFLAYRELEDGRLLALVPLTYGRVSLTLGPGGAEYDGGFSEAWDYEDLVRAFQILLTWNPAADPEPEGWTRHTPSMRRRGQLLAEEEEPHA